MNTLQNYISNNPNLSSVLQSIIWILGTIALLIITVFVVGFILDYRKKASYEAHKIKLKTFTRGYSSTISGGEEVYGCYWLWQRNKKKALVIELANHYKTNGVYTRHAFKKHLEARSSIPFREEVFAKL